jgi:hypothetical protein
MEAYPAYRYERRQLFSRSRRNREYRGSRWVKFQTGLITIDLDSNDHVPPLLRLNSPLAGTLRTAASRGCNIWLRCVTEYPPSCKLFDQHGKPIGECVQTVIKPLFPAFIKTVVLIGSWLKRPLLNLPMPTSFGRTVSKHQVGELRSNKKKGLAE